MSRLDDIKNDVCELRSVVEGFEYLIQIAEAAEELNRLFHYRDKVIPPESHELYPSEKSALRRLDKVLEGDGDE